mmetsp:Transcript_79969/g.154567  ORF Transcript_79969/g.154567 Transcript_79969/m.154567 type:complete len:155 (+) Transcript_79969:265-729(+)
MDTIGMGTHAIGPTMDAELVHPRPHIVIRPWLVRPLRLFAETVIANPVHLAMDPTGLDINASGTTMHAPFIHSTSIRPVWHAITVRASLIHLAMDPICMEISATGVILTVAQEARPCILGMEPRSLAVQGVSRFHYQLPNGSMPFPADSSTYLL